jgi:hypothetical protein
MNTNSTTAYLGALKRFWWLCGIGLVVAVAAAFLSVYSFSPSTFSLHHRARPTYTASALMLVNSAANPYLRTAVTVAPPTTKGAAPAKTAGGTTSATSSALAPAPTAGVRPAVVHAPDTHTLVQAANLFPLLIQSDQITRQRIAMFGGKLKGVVTAKAVYSFVTPSRFKQSSFPVIEVQAAAGGRKAAKRLAQETTLAFTHWLVSNQNASRVPASERILVQELQSPRGAIATGGTKKSLPLAVGAVVLALFLALAIALDRFLPRRAPASSPIESRSPAVA